MPCSVVKSAKPGRRAIDDDRRASRATLPQPIAVRVPVKKRKGERCTDAATTLGFVFWNDAPVGRCADVWQLW